MASFYTITLNTNGGSGGTTKLYYGASGNYKDHWYDTTSPDGWYDYTTKLPQSPTRPCYEYAGHWTAKSGGSRRIGADRTLYSSSSYFSAATTLYAHWNRISYNLSLEPEGGSGGNTYLFGRAGDGGWYADSQCTNVVSSINHPTRSGYIFKGFYSGQNGTGTKYINEDGSFTDAFRSLILTQSSFIYAH